MAYVPENPRELTTATEAVAAIVPTALQEETMALLRSVISREARGSLSPRSAQLLMQRLLPPLEPARIVQPVNLDDIPTPTSPKQYRAALRMIFRAAVDGQCSLDDARKAMILTKTLYRAECEVALRERQWTGTMQELEPDGADDALRVIAEAALPAKSEAVETWSEREVMRLAVVGRLAGDVSGAIAAHRLLADMHGNLRGGYRERRGQDLIDMTPEEEDEAILEAAEMIKAKRAKDRESDGLAK